MLSTLVMILFGTCWPTCTGNHDAKRLYDDLLRKSTYNQYLRPVHNASDKVNVHMGLKLSQIIDVDERSEIITLNMWVIQKWVDYRLKWDPVQYGDVKGLYVPSEKIWIPDIVLYDNADGDYTVTIMTKASVNWKGLVLWEPPAIYKSFCRINVKFFPFDEQQCRMKFGSWSHDGRQVDLHHISYINRGEETPKEDNYAVTSDVMSLDGYYANVEWDLMEVAANKHLIIYPCCENEPFPDITFNITIRRKTLFYTINMIIPCVALNVLTILAFYLPVDSREKISLTISLLLSLSLFQLLLMELVPPTSITMPLFGTYILFTCVVISISVSCSVVVLNVHYRKNQYPMPYCTRKLFLHILPRLLFMHKPYFDLTFTKKRNDVLDDEEDPHGDLSNYANPYKKKFMPLHGEDTVSVGSSSINSGTPTFKSSFVGYSFDNDPLMWSHGFTMRRRSRFPPNAERAIEGVQFISKHLRSDLEKEKIWYEWRYVALVVDRILLWLYISVCIAGAMSILLNAPVLYDNKQPLISDRG